jgi:hypothetical protein
MAANDSNDIETKQHRKSNMVLIFAFLGCGVRESGDRNTYISTMIIFSGSNFWLN